MFSVCLCAQYQSSPKEFHLKFTKVIFICLKGTTNLGLWYPKNISSGLKGYYDANFASCCIDQKITINTCPFLGPYLVSWFSRNQN